MESNETSGSRHYVIKIKMKQGDATHKYHFVSKKNNHLLGYLRVEYLKIWLCNGVKRRKGEDEKPVDERDSHSGN